MALAVLVIRARGYTPQTVENRVGTGSANIKEQPFRRMISAQEPQEIELSTTSCLSLVHRTLKLLFLPHLFSKGA